jgi:hypothetical protein
MTFVSVTCYDAPAQAGVCSRTMSIFLQSPDFSQPELENALSVVLEKEHQLDRLVFVGLTAEVEKARSILRQESSISARISACVHTYESAIAFIDFDPVERLHRAQGLHQPLAKEQAIHLLSEEKKFGLQQRFRDSGGLHRLPKGFHFGKKSEKHSLLFLRTANVLEDGASVRYVAFWLLPYIPRSLRRILIDTSGISDVATTVAFQARQLKLSPHLATITSHKSYEGLSELSIDNPDETLVIISASTSGGLAKKLAEEHNANLNNLITLYYCGSHSDNTGKTLCDLTQDPQLNPYGFEPIKSFPHDNCELCDQHSIPVDVHGDQFVLQPPPIVAIDIKVPDIPKALLEQLDQLASTGTFKVYRNFINRGNIEEIFFDVKELLASQSQGAIVREKVNRLLRRGTPVNLRRIVHDSYPHSDRLADDACNMWNKKNTGNIVTKTGIGELADAAEEKETASLVVTVCLDDPTELSDANRFLRPVQPLGNTTYVTIFNIAESDDERKRIRSNLTRGDQGRDTFNLYSLYEINFPHRPQKTSWSIELERLSHATTWADIQGYVIPESIHKRKRFLREAMSTGIDNDLFWSSCNGSPLKIQPDFIFIQTHGGSRLFSQADIYVAAASVLHVYRSGTRKGDKLEFSPYYRSVISPKNLTDRYTDPILQASFLRAARDHDLAYGLCESSVYSKQIFDYLNKHVLRSALKGDSEALCEFLIAILCRKLILDTAHLVTLMNTLSKELALPDHVKFIADYIAALKPE